jgi:hypothetical protein
LGEDEKKKQAEIAKIKQDMGGGRGVEAEIEEIRKEREKEQEEKEKEFLEQIRRQREAEMAERQDMWAESANPAKRKKKRGSVLMPAGKRKAMMPSDDQLSQTSEFKGKVD